MLCLIFVGLFLLPLFILRLLSLKFRFYLRYLCYYLIWVLSSLTFFPFMLLRMRDSRNGLLPAWAVRWGARLLLGVTFKVKGQDNILPEGQGCVVTLNHQSALDTIMMGCLWPHLSNGYFISARKWFWMNPIPWLWNTIYIDSKSNPRKAVSDMKKFVPLITIENARVCIFPEGSRNSGPGFLPFKKGAFHLALAAQCPIQPVVCSKQYFHDFKKYMFEPGHCVVEILPAIPTSRLTLQDLPELMERVRGEMLRTFDRISLTSLPAAQDKKHGNAIIKAAKY